MSGKSVIAFIPIKPKYANQIIGGNKKYEYRKVSIRPDLTHLIIYSSSPVKKIVGIAEVDQVEIGSPSSIWEKTKHASGITRKDYREYFKGRKLAYAIKLKHVHRLAREIDPEEIKNGFNIPQSFTYVPDIFINKITNAEKASNE